MKKIQLPSMKDISLLSFFGKNKYPLVSILICAVYFYATFFAISFVVRDIRDALSANDASAKNQVVGFDLDAYQKIAPRFESGAKK